MHFCLCYTRRDYPSLDPCLLQLSQDQFSSATMVWSSPRWKIGPLVGVRPSADHNVGKLAGSALGRQSADPFRWYIFKPVPNTVEQVMASIGEGNEDISTCMSCLTTFWSARVTDLGGQRRARCHIISLPSCLRVERVEAEVKLLQNMKTKKVRLMMQCR